MVKSYKTFIKEYSMGLQVPSTSYLKGVGSLRNLTKKEYAANTSGGAANSAGGDVPPQSSALQNAKPLVKKEVSDKLKGKVLDRKISRAKVKFKSKPFLTRP
jgi:hypothetical protein